MCGVKKKVGSHLRANREFYLFFVADKTVGVVVSLIYNADLLVSVVAEHEELVTEKVHLHDSLFHRHGLDGEGLLANDEFGLFLNVLACLEDTFVKCARAKSALKSGLVFSYLSFNRVDSAVESVSEGLVLDLASEDHTGGNDSYLKAFFVALCAERGSCLTFVAEVLIQRCQFGFDDNLHLIPYVHLSADNVNLHFLILLGKNIAEDILLGYIISYYKSFVNSI